MIALSPSVTVTESDLTNVVPAVSTSVGAAIVDAAWGPVLDVTRVDSENVFAQQFGKPNSTNAANWFAAANFLSYSGNLLVARTDTTNQRNAVANGTGTIASIPITSGGTGYTTATVVIPAPTTSGGVQATATATVAGGIITLITVVNPGTGYDSVPVVTVTGTNTTPAVIGTVVTADVGVKINNEVDYINSWSAGEGIIGEFAAKYPGALGNSLTVSMADSTSFAAWTYKDQFTSVPSTSTYAAALGASLDEMHVIVVDTGGRWTGTAGTVLEKFAFVSKASDAKSDSGATNYYKDVINSSSKYVWWTDHTTGTTGTAAWGTAATAASYKIMGTAVTVALAGGVDHFTSTDGQKEAAFDLFANDEQFDVNLVIVGKANATVANYVIQNIAEVRKDCMAFVSPENTSTGAVLAGNTSAVAESILTYRALLTSSSYGVLDTGYKYQYDKYNDAYRWVPLNGDVAGLCARTDATNDPWFSPAGFNRGSIKNVVKLAYSPRKADRDVLYNAGVNPVVSFPGQGTVLYGDKTLLSKPSAFDRINVRRLFIVLEKAIATASKYQLFEFNDPFSRSQFVGMVTPFLRDVRGRRGITDFLVVCDETNNTGEVVDTNRFVGDIFIKPARSINFITLNFIATRTGVAFSEVAGKAA